MSTVLPGFVSVPAHKQKLSSSIRAGKPTIQAATLDKAALKSSPIPPEWILEGEPEARCEYLSQGTLGGANSAHWSCTAGRFRWNYGWDETVLFLEGEAIITDDEGNVFRARARRQRLLSPPGTSAVWEVPSYIRKIAFNRRPPRYLLNLIDLAAPARSRGWPGSARARHSRVSGYWKAVSLKLLSLRECSLSGGIWASFSIARMPMIRC